MRYVLNTICRISLYTLLFLAVLLATTLLISGLVSSLPFFSFDLNTDLYVGLSLALVFWLVVASFFLRDFTLALPAPHHEMTLEKIRLILTDLGYEVVAQSPYHLQMRPEFQSLLGGGTIGVRIDDAQVKITGPKIVVHVVRNHLRLQQHLERMQQVTLAGRRRQGEKLLKRIQLSIKLTPEQIVPVYYNIVQALTKDAAVVCVLNLLAQSEAGIAESTLDYQIRDWLDRNGLNAEIQRDHIEWADHPETSAAV